MRKALAVSLLLVAAAGAFVFWVSWHPSEERLAAEQTRGFDLAAVDAAKAAPAPAAPAAVASNARPAAAQAPTPRRAQPAASPRRVVSPATGDPVNDLLQRPLRFIVERTLLGGSQRFQAFVNDPRRVGRYVHHPFVQRVLNDPAAVKVIAGRPIVVQAFLSSPAMSDPRAVSALARSRLLKDILESRGVQGALRDPAFAAQVFASPQTMAWLAGHPDALAAVQRMAPALAAGVRLPR